MRRGTTSLHRVGRNRILFRIVPLAEQAQSIIRVLSIQQPKTRKAFCILPSCHQSSQLSAADEANLFDRQSTNPQAMITALAIAIAMELW